MSDHGRGRTALVRRAPARAALALDVILMAFAAVSALAYAYR